jgi:uncharacterized protein DUF1580
MQDDAFCSSFEAAMTTDLLSELRLSLSALARRENVHSSTPWRWCLRGIRGHRLESFNVGGKRFTTTLAYERWIEAINGEPIASGQTARQGEREIDRAEKELDDLGV